LPRIAPRFLRATGFLGSAVRACMVYSLARGRSPARWLAERQGYAGVGVLRRDLEAAVQELYAPVERSWGRVT
jgi:hypothetical protein